MTPKDRCPCGRWCGKSGMCDRCRRIAEQERIGREFRAVDRARELRERNRGGS